MSISLSTYLAFKELWRNRGRFLLVSLVIALITLLVIFLAGLGEGLASANREFLSNLEGELILFQDQADLSVLASQLGRSGLNDIRRVPGVADAGPIGTSSVFVDQGELDAGEDELAISLIGIEPGHVGEPAVIGGRQLGGVRANEVIVDSSVTRETGLDVGDSLVIKSTQGALDEFYSLTIVGVTESQQYFFQPSVFVPLFTWDRVRPKPVVGNGQTELTYNIVNIKLEEPADMAAVIEGLESRINGIDVVDVVTAYESSPGYQEQQTTVSTQRGFTMLIGVLVVGGFFQIQTLQKVGQVGMLKALGAPNLLVALAASTQIVSTNLLGVLIGVLATLLLALGLPPTIPIDFAGQQVAAAIVTLLVIGPIGGLVSIRYLTRVEPLMALGLSS